MVRSIFYTINDIANMARERIRLRKDAIIFWTGVRGSGKSTGNWKFCKKLGKFEVEHLGVKYNFKKFKPKKDMIYTREDAIEFMIHRKYSIQMIDELIGIGYNREFSQTDQQAFIKAINQYRSNFNIISANNPFFYDLDPDLRNLCWMRIEVIRRGIACVHTPNESQYGNDPWDTDYNRKVERSWRKKDGSIHPNYKQLTTFRGFLVYKPMKLKDELLYESIRNEKRALANKTLTNQIPDKQMGIYDNLVNMALDKKLSRELFETICKINNIDYSLARRHINKKLKLMGKKETLKTLVIKEVNKEELDDLGYPKNHALLR